MGHDFLGTHHDLSLLAHAHGRAEGCLSRNRLNKSPSKKRMFLPNSSQSQLNDLYR